MVLWTKVQRVKGFSSNRLLDPYESSAHQKEEGVGRGGKEKKRVGVSWILDSLGVCPLGMSIAYTGAFQLDDGEVHL